MSWSTVYSGYDVHVIPVNDKSGHIDDTRCDCKPFVLLELGGRIIVHRAYDCREAIEQAEEILQETNK